ncbi:MAG: hypothetical protein GX220_05425 [Treponema sp.]|nr:hypothetical protein [Treponema sp.]
MIKSVAEYCNYDFNLNEIQDLLKIIRKYPEDCKNLNDLYLKLEQYIYSIMSIQEAEEFFNEKN